MNTYPRFLCPHTISIFQQFHSRRGERILCLSFPLSHLWPHWKSCMGTERARHRKQLLETASLQVTENWCQFIIQVTKRICCLATILSLDFHVSSQECMRDNKVCRDRPEVAQSPPSSPQRVSLGWPPVLSWLHGHSHPLMRLWLTHQRKGM